jgi:hypothetical protein
MTDQSAQAAVTISMQSMTVLIAAAISMEGFDGVWTIIPIVKFRHHIRRLCRLDFKKEKIVPDSWAL